MKFNIIILSFFFVIILALVIPIHATPVETPVNEVRQIEARQIEVRQIEVRQIEVRQIEVRQIVTAKAKGETLNDTPGLDPPEAVSHIAKRGLGAGAIAGIVIGLVVLFVGSGFIACLAINNCTWAAVL